MIDIETQDIANKDFEVLGIFGGPNNVDDNIDS